MNQSLAVKYRPQAFSDVVEQGTVRCILEQQIATDTIKHAYLFCGGAGTGKTTCARLFAKEINKGVGNPVELDAASNNSVEDVRTLIQQSRLATIDGSRYRVYILDECHALSNSAWQAMLKLLEEPPATAIFIFCTTDPQKIPKTILSRVQRYDFQRISQQGIIDRLDWILRNENDEAYEREKARGDGSDCEPVSDEYLYEILTWDKDALEYIAKIADGGMRDAITILDKCLAYDHCVSLKSVIATIGASNYTEMLTLTDNTIQNNPKKVFEQIEDLHNQGKDLKLFIRSYTNFVLDLCKYDTTGSMEFTQLPSTFEEELKKRDAKYFGDCQALLTMLLHLNSDIKWDTNPKAMIEAKLFEFCIGG